MNEFDTDTETEETYADFDDEQGLPPARYPVVAAEVKNVLVPREKAHTLVKWKIARGEFAGRTVFDRFSHKPKAAFKISSLAKATPDEIRDQLIVEVDGRKRLAISRLPELIAGEAFSIELDPPDEGYANNNVKPRSYRPDTGEDTDTDLPF